MGVKLSFSKISEYIHCPRKYFLSYICNLGTGHSPYLSHGSTVHKCCEDFEDWPEEEQTLENLISYYTKMLPEIDKDNLVHNIEESVDYETGELIKEVIINPVFEQKAIKSLTSFYNDYMSNDFQQKESGRNAFMGPNRDSIQPKIIMQEEWFNIKTKDGHEVRGLIDRVDEEIDGEHIVDYKTGQSRTTFKALQDPLDVKALQLSIYALARYKQTGKIPIKTSFFYLEPLKNKKVEKGEYRTAPQRTEEQLEKVEEFINDIGNEIQESLNNDDFPMGTSPNCFWCDFKDKCEILAEEELSERRKAIEIDNQKPKIEIDISDWI